MSPSNVEDMEESCERGIVCSEMQNNRPEEELYRTGVHVERLLFEIKYAYKYLKERSYPDSLLSRQCYSEFGKDNARATTHRNQGNAAYGRGANGQALKWYTKSIESAVDKSEELALAYANRSAILFRLGKFVPCLLDINRALKGEYPEHLRNKLQDRKKMCLLEIAKTGVKIVSICNETDPINLKATSHVPKGNLDNPLLPNTSSKIKLAFDEKWGRHMVAAQDIEPGEILSCEKFFVTFVYSYLQWTHCSYCSVRCLALIPCPSCSQAMYCSESCLNRAFNAYHRIECKMMSFLAEDENFTEEAVSVAEALRMLFIGTEQGTKLGQLTASLSNPDIFAENVNPVNKPYADDYLSILRICRTFKHPPRKSTIVAVKAIIWLQKCSFFENNPDPKAMSETELFATLTLLNHMQSLSIYQFSEMTMPAGNLPYMSGQEVLIGYGIIPLHNLVNHSCDPNVNYVATRDREQVIFSVKPIKRGEQIFTNYCPTYAKQSLAQRKRLLSPFKFTCRCVACTNDWPLSASMIFEEIKFVTRDVKIIAEIRETIQHMTENRVQNTDIGKLIRCRKLIHNYVRSPSLFATGCEDLIVEHMMWKYSNLCYEDGDAEWFEKNIDS